MATNEDLAVAFLCLAEKSEKEDLKRFILEKAKTWPDADNIKRLMDALDLPNSQISRKIGLLHSALWQSPHKKVIYEEMANRLANSMSALRSPLLKPGPSGKPYHIEANEHVLYLSLNPQGSA